MRFWVEEPKNPHWGEGDQANELLWHWEACCVDCDAAWKVVTDEVGLTAKALADLAEWAKSHVCGVA